MTRIFSRLRPIGVRLVQESVPEPTIVRLLGIRNFLRDPKGVGPRAVGDFAVRRPIGVRLIQELVPEPTIVRLRGIRNFLMTRILSGLRPIGVRLIQELVPEPTIVRLRGIRNFLRDPKGVDPLAVGDFNAVASNTAAEDAVGDFNAVASNTAAEDAVGDFNAVASNTAAEDKVVPFLLNDLVYGGKHFPSDVELVEAHGRFTCDVVVCCAFYGRYEILDLVLEEGAAHRADGGPRTMYCLVGSSPDDVEFLERVTLNNPNVFGTIVKNNPVGSKWQHSISAAYQLCDFELLGITGSDDILTSKLIYTIVERHRENKVNDRKGSLLPGLYATMEWLIYARGAQQNHMPQVVKCNYKLDSATIPLGAGRFYSREFIQKIGGVLFEIKRDILLDNFGFEALNKLGMAVEYYRVQDGSVCSVKGDWIQMNEFDDILTSKSVDSQEFSFEGYTLLKNQMTPEAFNKLFITENA